MEVVVKNCEAGGAIFRLSLDVGREWGFFETERQQREVIGVAHLHLVHHSWSVALWHISGCCRQESIKASQWW
jgi:hypothetical protein